MCAKVGVDPLASNKGFWAELLGIGDFYYELGWYQTSSLICSNKLVATFMLFPVTLVLPNYDKYSVSLLGSSSLHSRSRVCIICWQSLFYHF